MTISAETIERLRGGSTASIATLLLRRGLRNQYIQGARPLGAAKPMVGPAFTLRHIPAREDLDVVEAFRSPEHPQRVAVESVPQGYVLVMDCRQDATAASGGSILFTRLQMRGCAGVVSDAGVRDAATIAALDMPCYCPGPSAPTNLSRHHATDMNVPIGCGGVAVYPGDIIVGDGDGVIVIPAHLADEISIELGPMEAFEDFAIAEMKAGRPVIGTYPANEETKARYEAYCRGEYQPETIDPLPPTIGR
jgi:regulator of RNase E activity RraA